MPHFSDFIPTFIPLKKTASNLESEGKNKILRPNRKPDERLRKAGLKIA